LWGFVFFAGCGEGQESYEGDGGEEAVGHSVSGLSQDLNRFIVGKCKNALFFSELLACYLRDHQPSLNDPVNGSGRPQQFTRCF
jgi:hypothetical protein